MRPPGNVAFADQQFHHQQQQPAAQHRHPQHQNGHGGGRRVQIVDSFYPAPNRTGGIQQQRTNGHQTHEIHRNGDIPHQHHHHEQHHQSHNQMPIGSSPPQRCQCCPFGYHIDLDFVKFAEDVAAGKEQIQNWSSPAKKRARRLMVSPSSDRTLLDMSIGSDMANSSYPNDSSLMSKSLDVEELPEIVDQHQQHHQITSPPYSNGSRSSRAPSVPITMAYQPHGILKNASDWQHQQFAGSPTNYSSRTAPIPIRGGRDYQSATPQQHHYHYQPQQQHQSRFYEAHVQQQQQQHRRRYPLSMSAEHPSSPPTYVVGSPLRTSTPRGANDEMQQILAMQHQKHHQQPLHISTAMVNARTVSTDGRQPNGSGSTSAPSSPVPGAQRQPYQTAIAQSMAQLRKSPQKAIASATFGTKPQAHTSLSALSSVAKNAFTNPPVTSRRYYLESGGTRRVLSPEPHLPSMADSALRSSNLQSRAFFHQNNGSASAPGTVNRMPYRTRGAGSAPQIGPGFGSSIVELGEFASVRRRRLDADLAGSTTLPSAHLVRSVSPPTHLSSAYASSSPSSANSSSLPRWTPQKHDHQQTTSHSLANLENAAQLEAELAQYYDEGTLKPDKSKQRQKKQLRNEQHEEYDIPVQTVQATILCTSGTQTPPKPAGKEVGISTERHHLQTSTIQTTAAAKKEFKEIGTSPEPTPTALLPAEELPFAGLIQFASVGVDTRDLDLERVPVKKAPPMPPPKPSGPGVEAELRRRRQKELMGTLGAEFQYCLGHEPEHHPDHLPPMLEKRKFTEAQQQVNFVPETIERGVDAIFPQRPQQSTISTSTTDLAKTETTPPIKVNASTATLAKEMAEIGTATEARQNLTIGIQTDFENRQKSELIDNEAQTETGWLETEIGRKLAEAEAERKEKRKRYSVERSTETDEEVEGSPDQFIMITCNKCEQRSSVASDELFEKIIVPEEPVTEELKNIEQFEAEQQQEQMPPAVVVPLETVKEEPEFLLSGSSHEEMKIVGASKESLPKEELEMAKSEEIRLKEVPSILHELAPSQLEHRSMEMWKQVNIEIPTEEERLAESPVEMPKAQAVPSLVIIEEKVEERRQEIIQNPPDSAQPTQIHVASAESTPTTLSSQMDQLLQKRHQQKPSAKEQSTSPLSSDEGLVLAEEDFESPEMELDLDADRISIETDVQTVICVEPSIGQRSNSSASSSNKTPTTPTAGSSSGGEFFPSARTEALRKLLTEPPQRPQHFQREADSNRSYRSDKSKAQQLDLEYIAERHKSTDAQQLQSEPSTPCGSMQTRKALKETISLKKSPLSASSSNATFPPDPIPARIPRPKIARYSPNVALAETPDEEAEAIDRLTPLRSEMRSLSAYGGSSSPRMTQRALIFRTTIGGPLEEEDEEDLAEIEGTSSSSSKEQLPQESLEAETASSTSSEGARTYEMSEDDADFFELSAPLRDAFETINEYLLRGSKTPTTNVESEQQSNQIEWAHKYAQHEWLKMATRKTANAELVEQFIDALESYSTQLMETVINMTDQNGNTALHYSVSNENFDVVSVLLDSKVCRVDQMNKAGYSALMLGALCELRNETECAIMQRLFQMGNVNAKAVKHSQTALMLAASHGRVEATNLLLKCGADVNIQDVDGSTALMCAAEHGQKEIVKILLKQPNIDASLTDCDSQTALSIAVENQHRDIGVLIYAHLNFSRLADTSGDNSVSI